MNESELEVMKENFEQAITEGNYELAQDIVADLQYHKFFKEADAAQLVINAAKEADELQLETIHTLNSETLPKKLI